MRGGRAQAVAQMGSHPIALLLVLLQDAPAHSPHDHITKQRNIRNASRRVVSSPRRAHFSPIYRARNTCGPTSKRALSQTRRSEDDEKNHPPARRPACRMLWARSRTHARIAGKNSKSLIHCYTHFAPALPRTYVTEILQCRKLARTRARTHTQRHT